MFRKLGYKMPIITGMRFQEIPGCPHLNGYNPLGLWHRELLWGRDGLRVSLAEATKAARQHERGIAYFYEGLTTYVVITKTEDIENIVKNPGVFERGGVHPHLRKGMGNAIFFAGMRDEKGFASGPNRGFRKQVWQAKAFKLEQRLQYVSNMEEHADTTVAALRRLHEENKETPAVPLETIFTEHALGVLGDNLMGIKNLESLLERWQQLSKPLLRSTTNGTITPLGALKAKCKGHSPAQLNKAYYEFVQEALLAQVPEAKDHDTAKMNLIQAIREQHEQEADQLAEAQAKEKIKAAHAKEAKALATSLGGVAAAMDEILKKQEVVEEIELEKARILAANRKTTKEGILADAGFLLFSGHDTTAQSLTTNIKLLAAHPDVVEKVRRVIFKNCYDPQTGTLDLSFDKLNPQDMGLRPKVDSKSEDIFYLHQLMDETQRLFPPIPYIERVVNQDVEIPDPNKKGQVLKLKKGDRVIMDAMSLHRTPEFYKVHGDPETFQGEERNLNVYAPFRGNIDYRFNALFLNFGRGVLMCPGFLFALQEMKILLARLIMNFDFKEVGENNFDFTVNDFVLKFKKPTYIDFVPRDVVKELALELEKGPQQSAPAEAARASSVEDAKPGPVVAADVMKAVEQLKRRRPA